MPSAPPLRVFSAKRGLALPAWLCAFFVFLALAASAQLPTPADAPPPPPTSDRYVLHAYADLLRVPTLVLDRHETRVQLDNLANFNLQIDSGPVFHPVLMHTEGAEPISLAIVLDATGAVPELLKALPNTPGHGLPTTLSPQDTVSVFAFDCRTFRSAEGLPATHLALRDAVQRVLSAPGLHSPKGKTCQNKKQLWEAISVAARELAAQQGWRAMIVLSDGEDNASHINWVDLAEFASSRSIAIFGLREPHEPQATMRPPHMLMTTSGSAEDIFAELAGRTGGIVYEIRPANLPTRLDHIVDALRSRYVLQFSRPVLMTGGRHHLDVRVSARDALVLAAGTSAPARDATLLNDPTTVPMDTSKLPVVGNRKPMKQ